MVEHSNFRNSLLSFLRLESANEAKWTLSGIILGSIIYIFVSPVTLPSYTFFGLDLGITVIPITGGLYLGLVVIILVASFYGPLAGLLVGFIGHLGSEILFTQQIVAMGMVGLSFGMLGFIVGIPRYAKNEGFANGKNLGKMMLFTLIGYFLMTMLYLVSLMVVANQSFDGTLLYNFVPYFSITILSLFLFAPVFVRVYDILIAEAKKYWKAKSGI
ncbi:MAG: hypothetical protein EAX86_06880 [Candidatus Heimdallarchaeota archaeon]|nr:hypothetical protein [Candidatus Heimdallarchaeota archaeon]